MTSHELQQARDFVDAMRAHFEAQPERPRSLQVPKLWVAGGITRDADPVIVYRDHPDGPLVGRRWDLRTIGTLFSTDDPEVLADVMWDNEVEPPDREGVHLEVDWAEGLVDDPSRILWQGQPR